MPFHFFSFFMSRESEWLDEDEKNSNQGPFLSPSLSQTVAGLFGLSSLLKECWVIFQGFHLSEIFGFMGNVGDMILVMWVL